MAVFCSRLVDYVFIVICISVLLTSTILNPIIFWFRFPKIRSHLQASSLLFLLLSVTDFLTNISFPVILAVTLARPSLEPPLRPATNLDKVHFVMFRTLAGASAMITAMLAVTRWLQIRYTMLRIKNKLVLGHLLLFSVGPLFAGVLSSALRCSLSDSRWSTNFQTIISNGCGLLPLATHWLIIAHAWFGLIVSLVTVVGLKRSTHPTTAPNTRRSITAILLMNTVLTLHTVVSIIVMLSSKRKIDWSTGLIENPEESPLLLNITLYYLTPLIMSALNPLILFMCNKRIRLFTKIKLSIIKDRTLSETH